MGAGWRRARLIPTAYLSMQKSGFTVMLGAIPYSARRGALPGYLRYDSLTYARPNIEGAYMRYESHHGHCEFMCDWRGMPTRDRREMFLLLLNGEFHWRWVLLGGYAQLNHKASYGEGRREGVCDDAYLHAYAGIDLGPTVGIDSLTLRCGYVQGYQRERESRTRTPRRADGAMEMGGGKRQHLLRRAAHAALREVRQRSKPGRPLLPIAVVRPRRNLRHPL